MKPIISLLAAAALAGTSALTTAQAADLNAIMTKSGCASCHAVDKKIIGPAYKEVAAKYKGQPNAAAQLFDKVRKGGSGVWGPIPMSPNAPGVISDDDLKQAIAMILKL